MGEDLVASPWTFDAVPALRPVEVPPEHIAPAQERGPDPLECGFLLVGGVLAPLPGRIRLPHEADDDEDADGERPDDDEDADGERPVDV